MPEAYGSTTVIALDIDPKTDLFVLRCFRKRHGAPLSSPKTASLVGPVGQGWPIESCGARTATQDDPLDRSPDATKWNPGLFKAAENSRITFHAIRATACEARAPGGVLSFGYFSLDKQRQIHPE
jgi:hypothetical protein